MAGPLGEFEVLVLMAVLHQGGRGYGTTILREISERAGRQTSRGAVYVTLERLEDKRLVASSLGESLPQRGGRPRRIYRLTPAGTRAVRQAIDSFVGMHAGLEALLRKS